MRHCTCIVLALSLGACATKPVMPLPPPEPIVRTVTVDHVVTVPCISAVPDLPMYSDTDAAIAALTPDFNGAWLGVSLLKGGRAQRDSYISQLRAILGGCTAK